MCDADAFPLSLNALVKLFAVLAPTGDFFEKVEKFLMLTMPEGFPVKLDIPVFPTVSLRLTFGTCNVGVDATDEALFDVPGDFVEISVDDMEGMHLEEDAEWESCDDDGGSTDGERGAEHEEISEA